MKIADKKAGNSLEVIDVPLQYRMAAVAHVLGKAAAQFPVWLDSERTLAFVCDENAALRKQPVNFFIEAPNPFAPVQAIAGDVVFIRTKPCDPATEEIWDYEVEDLLDTDIQLINYLLDDGKQVSLAMQYFARGGY
jgi:hypothetical protein